MGWRCAVVGSLFVLLTPGSLAQGNPTLFWIKVNDSIGGYDSLTFGNHPFATYCVDTGLGENYSPPFPPSGFFAVFLSIPGRANCFTNLGLIKKDLRGYNLSGTDTFLIRIANLDSAAQLPSATATLRWPDMNYLGTRCDSMFLVDPSQSIIKEKVNMFSTESIILDSVYNPTGPNPSAPLFKFFIYIYGVRPCSSICDYPPIVHTLSATEIDSSAATLNGSVIPGCYWLDSVTFEYGATTAYGNEIVGVQGSGYRVSATITGLQHNTTYHFRIAPYLHFSDCCSPCSSPCYGEDSSFTTDGLTIVKKDDTGIPPKFVLNQNYPNPLNPSTVITYDLPSTTHVKLMVFDMLGQEVARLVDETEFAGRHTQPFNAAMLSSGAYIYTLSAGSNVQSKIMTVIR